MAQAQMIFTMPAEFLERVVTAFCTQFGYQESTVDGDGNTVLNPQSREEFAGQRIASFMKSTTSESEQGVQVDQLRSQIVADINANAITTETT